MVSWRWICFTVLVLEHISSALAFGGLFSPTSLPKRGCDVRHVPHFRGLRGVRAIASDDPRHPGVDPSKHLDLIHSKSLPAAAVSEFFERGWTIIDTALDDKEAADLEMCLGILARSDDALQQTPEASVGIRDDFVRFVDEESAMIPVRKVISRLKGYAEFLQDAYVMAQSESSNSWPASQGTAISPASDDRPLTVSEKAQIASYNPGGIYKIHSDNSRDESGERRNHRAITAIAYAQPKDWSDEEDKGQLRLWLNSDEIDLQSYPEDEVLREEAMIKDLQSNKGPTHIDISPKAGRIILFRSTLLHQVCASVTRPRRALTVWAYAPSERPSE